MLTAVIGSWRLLSKWGRFRLALLAFGGLSLNFLDIAAISLIGLIGTIALGGELDFPGFSQRNLGSESTIPYLLGLAALLFLFKTVVGLVLAKSQFIFLAKIETEFSGLIARHVFGSDLSTLKGYSRSDLEWLILRSTDIAFSRVLGRTLVLVGEIGLAFLILGLFFYVDWISALVVISYFSAVFAALQILSLRKSKLSGADVTEGSISVGQSIADSVAAFKEISILGRLDYFVERIRRARERVALGNATHLFLQSIPRLIMELSLILGAIGFVAFLSIRGEGSPNFGLLSVFVVGSLRMMSALLPLQRAFGELRFYAPQAASAQKLIQESSSYGNLDLARPLESGGSKPNHVPRRQGPLRVEVKSLNFEYSDRRDSAGTLTDINLSIEPGQTLALIGPSGSGKSTLVDVILGLHEPTSGRVYCGGVPPSRHRLDNPGAIGYVPQQPGLVSGTIRDNVALGVPALEIDHVALIEALKRADIFEFVQSLPLGLDTTLGRQVNSLSGGQIQRIGLARSLYTRPSLLILDEATSALDAASEASIISSLRALKTKPTTVVVAHRLSTIQNADQIVLMDRGRVAATGSFSKLANASPTLRQYISLMDLK